MHTLRASPDGVPGFHDRASSTAPTLCATCASTGSSFSSVLSQKAFEAWRERRSTRLLLFSSTRPFTQVNVTSRDRSSTSAKSRFHRSLFLTGPLGDSPSVVFSPSNVPLVFEAFLAIRALRPNLDDIRQTPQCLADCCQFHSVVGGLPFTPGRLFRYTVRLDQSNPASPNPSRPSRCNSRPSR